MYFLNLHHAFSNMAIFERCRSSRWSPLNLIRKRYFSLLGQAQGIALTNSSGVTLSFDDSVMAKTLKDKKMFVGEGMAVGSPMTKAERRSAAQNIQLAFELLTKLDARLRQLTEFVVSDLVCVKVQSSDGGTSSNLLGIIWLSPHGDWTPEDFAECLVHETVHNTVFLGDMVHRIYVDPARLSEPAAQTISSIRKTNRPLDKSFHSACVAVGIAYLYHLLGNEDQVNAYLEPLKDCVAGLRDRTQYLAPYGRTILGDLEKFVESRDFVHLSNQIADPNLARFDYGGSAMAAMVG